MAPERSTRRGWSRLGVAVTMALLGAASLAACAGELEDPDRFKNTTDGGSSSSASSSSTSSSSSSASSSGSGGSGGSGSGGAGGG